MLHGVVGAKPWGDCEGATTGAGRLRRVHGSRDDVQKARGLDDEARGIDIGIRQAQRGDDAFAASCGRPQVDEEHLVFVMLDQIAEGVAAAGQIDRRELTLEDRTLQVVAEVAQGP